MAMDAASVLCMFCWLQVYKSLFILFSCIHPGNIKQHVGCLMHLVRLEWLKQLNLYIHIALHSRHPSPKVAFQSRRAALTGAQQPFAV